MYETHTCMSVDQIFENPPPCVAKELTDNLSYQPLLCPQKEALTSQCFKLFKMVGFTKLDLH